MRFINPKTDLAFKRIFGSEHSGAILRDFLDAVLYDSQGQIADLEILNPWAAPKVRGMKDSYLDVRARLRDGSQVIIEMQVLNVEGFEKRILYNAAKIYSTQLGSGDSYTLLNPVIALTLTDFVMFEPLDGYLSRFVLKEKTYLLDYPLHDIELVFIELPKFKRPLDQLTTRAEQWLYFIQHARDLSAVPDSLGQAAPLRQAFDLAAEFNLSPEELDDLERREIFIHDQRNAIIKAEKQGLKQGLQQGLQQGLLQGLQQGDTEALRRLLQRRFNELPPWVETRLSTASKAELETWIDRVLDAESLTAVFD